ncbi:MAG TPA: hypothetical protein VKR06_05050 [Ktedonosporobacter sp.]|nr:hypothetical protein [Ktedonosporobacter sp.]
MSIHPTHNPSGKQNLGAPAPVTDTVQRLTSRPPRSVQAWAADLAAHLR